MDDVSSAELYEIKQLCDKDRIERLTVEEQARYDHILKKAMYHVDKKEVFEMLFPFKPTCEGMNPNPKPDIT